MGCHSSFANVTMPLNGSQETKLHKAEQDQSNAKDRPRIWGRGFEAQMDGRAGLFFARARFTAGSEIGASPPAAPYTMRSLDYTRVFVQPFELGVISFTAYYLQFHPIFIFIRNNYRGYHDLCARVCVCLVAKG